MEELDDIKVEYSPTKRRCLGDKNHITSTNYQVHNDEYHETQRSDLEFNDLRHESLNHILKENMEILNHNDMHNFDDGDGVEDDENNNNSSVNEERSPTNCADLKNMSKCNSHKSDHNNEDDDVHDVTLVQFNQLIDDECEPKLNCDDGVSYFNFLK